MGKSEKAFNMITAGMDAREERRRGSGGGKEQRRGHAHIDKYFIPQHTESVRPGPRREGGAGRGEQRMGKRTVIKSREDKERKKKSERK